MTLTATSAQAQSWLDALKGVATTAIDKVTGGQLTANTLYGTWSYNQPGIKLSSSTNTLSDLTASAATSTLQSKMAKYYELTESDVVATVLTDSAVMYASRIQELNDMYGAYTVVEAAMDHGLHMLGMKTDNLIELTYADRKRVHNLKYYTWVEQQGKTVEEINALWYDTKGTWDAVHAQAKELDELICQFNEATGLLKNL